MLIQLHGRHFGAAVAIRDAVPVLSGTLDWRGYGAIGERKPIERLDQRTSNGGGPLIGRAVASLADGDSRPSIERHRPRALTVRTWRTFDTPLIARNAR